jgi:two-component system, NarL family, sensor histidine kinase DevS
MATVEEPRMPHAMPASRPLTSAIPDPLRLRRLLESGRALVADLDPQAVLERTLAAARELTGARYAGLGILDEQRAELEQFLTVGIDDVREALGDLPARRGLLGLLIDDPRPLRLRDLAEHPCSRGQTDGQPAMGSFLGVPILIRGAACGALYLTEKHGGEFTDADEEGTVILAAWAATAIENARRSQSRQLEHEQTVRDADAHPEIAIPVGVETGLGRVLELIVARGQTLIEASGPEPGDAQRSDDAQALRTFASSAATAIAMARSAESDRLRSLIAAADAERSRWARELHDETLQGLGALRLLLAASLRRGDANQTVLAVGEAIGHIEQEIGNLHAIISDLRPAALDELGLRPALEALLERRTEHGSLAISSLLVLPDPRVGEDRLEPEIESTVYRVVQEALTNIVKHASADEVHVAVTAASGAVSIEVRDDGVGFGPKARGAGFGLAGMRERVQLAGGTVRIDSGKGGTRLRAELPAHARTPTADRGLGPAAR